MLESSFLDRNQELEKATKSPRQLRLHPATLIPAEGCHNLGPGWDAFNTPWSLSLDINSPTLGALSGSTLDSRLRGFYDKADEAAVCPPVAVQSTIHAHVVLHSEDDVMTMLAMKIKLLY